jgi:hypothetical protein
MVISGRAFAHLNGHLFCCGNNTIDIFIGVGKGNGPHTMHGKDAMVNHADPEFMVDLPQIRELMHLFRVLGNGFGVIRKIEAT